MGKGHSLRIAGAVFATKEAAREYIRQMKALYTDDQPLRPEHQAFVLDLVCSHPWATRKTGCGVSQMLVRTVQPFKTRSVYFVRTNGTSVEVSGVVPIFETTG